MKHKWFLEASPDPIPELQYIDPPTIIDFKIVYTMVQTMPHLEPVKIVKAMAANRHNQITATYYLLCEKKRQQQPNREWKFEEQQHFAKTLGFQLQNDGVVVFEPDDHPQEGSGDPDKTPVETKTPTVAGQPKVIQQIEPHDATVDIFNDAMGQSEYTKTDFNDDQKEMEEPRRRSRCCRISSIRIRTKTK
jgi:hypothetical protein